jgi:uracil-DNA glycosylase family protein
MNRVERLRREAADCRRCELWRDATQTVFGQGDPHARVMLVGEQPGDKEDLAGHPFVGPAGRVLDEALQAAKIDRGSTYVTNAVKHFRFEQRGKRRIHKRPGGPHIKACHPWLDEEIKAVQPELVVCLGAVASQSLLGSSFRLTKHRGEIIRLDGKPPITATVHPSSILRAPDDEARHREMQLFIADLRSAARFLKGFAA